jgi:hypothetical protein
VASKIENPQDRTFIANLGELTFLKLKEDPSTKKRVLNILGTIQQWKGMSEEQSRAFREIQSILTTVNDQYSYEAGAKDATIRKQIIQKATVVRDEAARSKKPFTDEQYAAAANKSIGNSGLREQVEQVAAKIAIIDTARSELAPQKGEKSTQMILAELGLSEYSWEQIMADPALHPIFQNAANNLSSPSTQLEKMRQILVELTSRELQRRAATGNINTYHTDNAARLRWEYGSYYYGQGGSNLSQEGSFSVSRNTDR